MTDESIIVVEFDFTNRSDRVIPVDEAPESRDRGNCCWIDIDVTDGERARTTLERFGVNEMAIDESLLHEQAGRHDVYDDCLHVSVSAPHVSRSGVNFNRIDLIIGERFIFTLHRGHVGVLQKTRNNYQKFFSTFAQSLGFLLFELWDHLIDSYREAFRWLEDEVEAVQGSIFGTMDDSIFNRVSEITHDLLVLRRNIFADREVLEQMALHKSSFVSDTTQPYLKNMVGTLERLGSDLAVERDILTDTLTLYLGIVSHRTNRVINRLTVINAIFLPLTFVVGVYGMNFRYFPELQWRYGYLYFWILVFVVMTGLLGLIKRLRWL